MSSINPRVEIILPVKEAIYTSKITGGTTRIQIKKFIASFSIHTRKSNKGDFYPTSFKIYVESTIGHEYSLDELELIAVDQERSEIFANLGKFVEELHENQIEMRNKIQSEHYRNYVKEKLSKKGKQSNKKI